MNLVQVIEKEHSKAQRDIIVAYIGQDAARFDRLVEGFLEGPYRITQRAAWPLSHCAEKYPELIKPHLKRIIKNLKKDGIPDAVKRNTVRLLQFVTIPKSLQDITAAICFSLFQNPKEPIAIRVFSMTVLARIAWKQPDLKNELRMRIEKQLPFASGGFLSRARMVLKQLA